MGIQRTLNMFRNIKNWDTYLRYKLGGKKGDYFTFQLMNDYEVSVRKAILPEFKESFFEEAYFKYFPKNLLTKSNPTVIDIGANVGFFSIFAYTKFNNPRIFSYEPIRRNFLELQKNTQKIPRENITIVNSAVSNSEGELSLKFNENQLITTSASIFDNELGSDIEVVPSMTLSAILNKNQINQIDFLKLDCEGAEYEIIYQSPLEVLRKIKNVAIETHKGQAENENTASLISYLQENGFQLHRSVSDFIWASQK